MPPRPLIPVLRHWPAAALLASVAMLAVAHGFETFGHLPPCHMCLQQRDAYWAAATIALIGMAAERTALRARWRPWVCAALAAAFLIGGAIALRQAGAEWGWWPGPASCSGVHYATAADIARALDGAGSPAPRCDVAAWRLFGISMAGWNVAASAILASLSAWGGRSVFTRMPAPWRNTRSISPPRR